MNATFTTEATASRAEVYSGSSVAHEQERAAFVEFVLFWVFIAGLAWAPYWYGGNDYVAWGINAALFCGLVVVYEVTIVARGKTHPVGLKEVWISATLFAAVVAWIIVQNASWTPPSWHHPIWAMASNALGRPVNGSISVNRDLTTLALMRLITAASVFWLALQLCRDGARAVHFMVAMVVIVCGYSAYGIVAVALKPQVTQWQGGIWSLEATKSTFVNHNHFGTYAGIGLVIVLGFILKLYLDVLEAGGEFFRSWIASIIEATVERGAILFAAAFLIVIALIGSGSRGAVLATGLGLLVASVLLLGGSDRQSMGRLGILALLVAGAAVAALIFLAFGDRFFGKITEAGLSDSDRMAVYIIVLRSIIDAPLLGYGYGTFIDVFPMFRDRSLNLEGGWDQAHNTYLELFQGLGLVFGTALVGVRGHPCGQIFQRSNGTPRRDDGACSRCWNCISCGRPFASRFQFTNTGCDADVCRCFRRWRRAIRKLAKKYW